MRVLLAVALASAFAGSASPADAPAPPARAPRIAVEPSGFDFGSVRAGQAVDKEFVVRNFGEAELVIESVTTTCGCTVAEGWSRKVPPGGTTPLRVKLTVGSRPGPLAKSVLVKSNDPARPKVEIRLQATVVAPANPRAAGS